MMIDPRDLLPYGMSNRPGAYCTPWGSPPAPKGDHQPCVYFVEAKGVDLVKIGTIIRVSTIQKRIEALQTGCPYELRLAMIVDGGGRREEHRYHKALDHLRFRNEWFRREGVLADMLDAAKVDEKTALEIAIRLIGA